MDQSSTNNSRFGDTQKLMIVNKNVSESWCFVAGRYVCLLLHACPFITYSAVHCCGCVLYSLYVSANERVSRLV